MILKFMEPFEIIDTDFYLNNLYDDNTIEIEINIKPINIFIKISDKFCIVDQNKLIFSISAKKNFNLINDSIFGAKSETIAYDTINIITDESIDYYTRIHQYSFYPVYDKSIPYYEISLNIIKKDNGFRWLNINNIIYDQPIITIKYDAIINTESNSIIATINKINLEVGTSIDSSENKLLLFYFEEYYLHILNQLNYLLYDGAIFGK